MEMKWNPIVNGDLSEVPLFEDVLFTIINEDTGTSYVICDELNSKSFEGDGIAVFDKWVLDRVEKVLAWAELPEPYKLKYCNVCPLNPVCAEKFGDQGSECKLDR